MVEIIQFPKMCCGQPVKIVKKFSSGSGFVECRVTGEFLDECPNRKPKFLPPIVVNVVLDP